MSKNSLKNKLGILLTINTLTMVGNYIDHYNVTESWVRKSRYINNFTRSYGIRLNIYTIDSAK